MTDNNHPDAKGSYILGAVCLLILVLDQLLGLWLRPIIFKDAVFLIVDVILSLLIVVLSIVNFKNTFETNDPWKTWCIWIATVASVGWIAGWIAAQFTV